MNEEKNINRIPEDWKWVKLGEACEIVSGNTPKGLELISNKGEYQFYKVSDMNLVGNEVKMNVSNLKLTLEEINKLKVKVYPKGTVIFPKRGGAILTNKKRVLSQDASFDLNVMGILPNDKISSPFLFYWIQKLDLSKIYDGSNVPQINNKNVAPLDFPFPPKPTQHAIVSKIEELFSELDKGIENLRTAQQQLKTYRQSVLKWAFEGKLTNKNMKEGELPNEWKWVSIEFLLSDKKRGMGTGPFGTMLKKSEHQKSGVPVLGIENIGEGVFQMPNKIFVTDEKAIELKNFRVKENDIIISRSGTVGEICLLPKKMENSIISTNLIRVSLNLEIINPKYFVYLFQGGKVRQQVFDLCKGSSRAFLNQTILNSLDFPYCSIEEQNTIIQEIESRLSVADIMEDSITESLQEAEALRQSVLKKAFEGRLI